MPGCPDCGADQMKKHGGFYVCERCGLSIKPWELQKAQQRAKEELEELMSNDELTEKEREARRYKRWIEGQKEIDD